MGLTLMSNKEAAEVIKNLLKTINIGRANGKSRAQLMANMALCKAIKALETAPDEDKNPK